MTTAGNIARLLLLALVLCAGCSGGGADPTPDPDAIQPNVSGLSINAGNPGDQFTITGLGFGNTQGSSTVEMNGVGFVIISWSDTAITAQIVAGMTSGIVVVTVGGLGSQSGPEAQLFIGAAPDRDPIINAISPDYGVAGEAQVQVIGFGFGSDPSAGGVYFPAAGGGVAQAEVVTVNIGGTPVPQWTDASIKAIVPANAVSGALYVQVGAKQSNTRSFTVLPPQNPPGAPTLSSVAPLSGPVGTLVTIDGANFGHNQGGSTLLLNGVGMNVITWGNTQLIASVPAGATSGPIRVTVAGVAVESGIFTVGMDPEITGLTPTDMRIGKPVTIYGKHFGIERGTGSLRIGGTAVTPDSWNDIEIKVDSLPAISAPDPDNVLVEVTTDAGGSDSILGRFKTGLSVLVNAAPTSGEATVTAFNFYVTVTGGSGSYEYTLIPDGSNPSKTAPPTSSNPVVYTYTSADVGSEPREFATQMKVVDKVTKDTAIVSGQDGQIVSVVPFGQAVITGFAVQDYNFALARAPRNDWVYTFEPPLGINELYHDFSFIGAETIFASGLSDYLSGGNPVTGYTVDHSAFMAGGATERPYGYRYNGGDGKGSMVRILGLNFGDTPGDILLNSEGLDSTQIGTLVPPTNLVAWTDTAIDFYMPQNVNDDLSGTVAITIGGDDIVSSMPLICSPYITDIQPNPVSLTGQLALGGFDLVIPEVPGIIGDQMYLIFVVNASYDDPFTGTNKNGAALLVRPIPVTPLSDNMVQFNMATLGASGEIEVYSPTGDDSAYVEGTYVAGTYYVFFWNGALTTGPAATRANSGIFSEAYQLTVTAGGPPPGNHSVSGQVTSMMIPPPNNGVAGIVVTLTPGGFNATTGATGNYTINNVPDGNYTATPTDPGDPSATFAPATAPVTVAGSDVNGINFSMVGLPTP